MKNQPIRDEVRRARLYMQDLAKELNMSESNLYYRLRKDLTEEQEKEIYSAIDRAAEKRLAARGA